MKKFFILLSLITSLSSVAGESSDILSLISKVQTY